MKRTHILCFLFFALLTSTADGNLYAQWNKIGSHVFAPDYHLSGGAIGYMNGTLCGGYSSIFISLDTGKTWRTAITLSTLPALPLEYIECVDFFDSANFLVRTNTKIYITADQGNTWRSISIVPVIAGAAACFAGSPSRIVANTQSPSSLIDSVIISSDGGNTWIATYSYVNNNAGNNQNDRNSSIQYFKYRSNGIVYGIESDHIIISYDYGMSWSKSNVFGGGGGPYFPNLISWTLAFSPCDSSNQLFLVNEFNGNILPPYLGYIYGTTDKGTTWQLLFQSPGYPGYAMSGYIGSAANSIFCGTTQGTTSISKGIFRSSNQGLTWDSIGGPSAYAWGASRLVVPINDNLILAEDNDGNLWRTDNAGGFPYYPPSLIFSTPDSISTNECLHDSTKIIITGQGCQRYHIVSAKFLGPDTASLRLYGKKPPFIMSNAVINTIGIAFDPKQNKGIRSDSIKIVWYNESEGVLKNITIAIPITVNPVPPNLKVNITLVKFKTSSLCEKADSIIKLHNSGCDTLRISSGPDSLGNTFTADTLTYPIFLPPDSTIFYNLHFHSPVVGNYATTGIFQADHGGDSQQISFKLTGIAAGYYVGLSFPDSLLTLLPSSTCVPKRDSVVYLSNSSCDTLVITSGPTGLANGFSADALSLPLSIPPGDSIPIIVHFNPTLIGILHSSASFAANLKGFTQTQSFTLSGQSIGSNPGLSSDAVVNFRNVSICNPNRDTSIKIFNRGCYPLTITSGPDNVGNGFTADALSLPALIPIDSFIILHYHFHPGAVSQFTSIASFSATSNGKNQTFTQQLTGNGTGGSSGPITLATSFIFDTLSTCGQIADTTIEFTNIACDTLKILSGPTLSSGFTVSAQSYPIILPPNDSVAIIFHFSPTSVGKFSTQAIFRIEREHNQSNYLLYLEGNGKSEGGVLSYSPQQFNFQTLSICAHDTASGNIINVGCTSVPLDPAKIFGDPDYQVSGVGNVVTVKPNDTIAYKVYLNPAEKGLRTGYIIFTSTNSRDSIPMSVTVTDGTRILSSSVNAVDFGIHSPCDYTSTDTTVTLRNSGCDTLVITGVLGLNSEFGSNTKFPIILLPGQSSSFDIFTTLDTSGGKTSYSTTLTFTSNADAVSPIGPILLTQTYLSSTTKRDVGLFIDPTTKKGNNQNTITYDIKESIGKTFTGAMIPQISFDLSYNTNLLTFDQSSSSANLSGNGKTFTITGTPNIQASANGILASIGFKVFLTTDSVTIINMTSRVDTTRGPCGSILTTSIESSSAAFIYSFTCGEKTISDYLNGVLPMKIISVHPNPSQGEVTIDLNSAMDQNVTIEILNVLGEKIREENINILLGTSSIPFDTKNFTQGMYIIRIQSGSGVISQSFVKVQ